MSVAVIAARPPLAGAFYDDFEEALQKDVDWGTATPINSLDEVKVEDDFGSAVLQRGTKRSSLQMSAEDDLPEVQRALLLHALREPFQLKEDYKVPEIASADDIVVKISAIGLNPIDWKSV